jgi:RNA-directed DNA polymerase
MMCDRGKPDSAIVAMKPTNNAGEPAAEPVEPRAGTKRNAGEQSTHRTQGRTGVTQALARVRKAAQQGGRRGSQRSSTTSASIYSGRRSSC